MSETTRFGSPWRSRQQCVSVLRAHLSRHHITLPHDDHRNPAAEAAAVVAVELWMWAVGANSLQSAARYGKPATSALAAALALLTSPSLPPAPAVVAPREVPDSDLFVAVEVAGSHVASWGLDPNEVLGAAASALVAGASDTRLHAAAAIAACSTT